jgi:hypothetical protein
MLWRAVSVVTTQRAVRVVFEGRRGGSTILDMEGDIALDDILVEVCGSGDILSPLQNKHTSCLTKL